MKRATKNGPRNNTLPFTGGQNLTAAVDPRRPVVTVVGKWAADSIEGCENGPHERHAGAWHPALLVSFGVMPTPGRGHGTADSSLLMIR
jgi:hypothetical protein